MNKGVPTLHNPHKLCEKGQVLSGEQAQLLKLIGEKMVIFRVRLIARWAASSGEVEQIEGGELVTEEHVNSEEDAMSE
jgi:mRNA turnover protein 4